VIISYAQNGEDVVLHRAFKTQTTGFYIDVGAWDPDEESVTKHFYLRGWRGINIEPCAHYFARLAAARARDINLNVAVGIPRNGKAHFIEYEGTGLSALAETANRQAIEADGYKPRVTSVDLVSLAEITTRYAPCQVDFLKIDVEGAERQVIESGEWHAFRPRVVVVESITALTHRPTWFAWEGLLFDAGYRFALFDGINRFYYRAEEPELREPLSLPANALDEFVLARMAKLHARVAELESKLT
jgi:FkbM family methyltransferase